MTATLPSSCAALAAPMLQRNPKRQKEKFDFKFESENITRRIEMKEKTNETKSARRRQREGGPGDRKARAPHEPK